MENQFMLRQILLMEFHIKKNLIIIGGLSQIQYSKKFQGMLVFII